MKRVLSLVLALVLVLGTILPVFAEEVMTAGEELKSLGVIAGSDTGLDEDQPLTRAQAAVVISEMYGKKDEAAAYAFPASFTDVEEGMWYTPYIAYAEAQGWMSGDGEGLTFRPNDTMKAQELNAMYLVVLGYTVEWAEVNAQATELEFAVDAADATLVLRGEAFEAILAALDVMPMDEEATLGTKLALEGYVAPTPPAPEVFEVASVEVINLVQTQVMFNQEVDADSAETAGNYTITDTDDNDIAISAADLLEDGKTVVLTHANAGQQTVAVVEVEDTETAEEVVVADYTSEEVTYLDMTIPTALTAEVVGVDTIKVTFSEPVTAATLVKANFEVDGGDLYINTVEAFNNNTEANITLYSDLDAGDVTVEVTNDVEDEAGFGVVGNTFTVTVVEDADAPVVVGYKDATTTGVTLIFSEEIEIDDATLANYYHTNGNSPVNAAPTLSDDSKELTLVFAAADALPEGTAYVYVADDSVNDLWDNLNEQQMIAVEVTLDVTAPEVDSIEVITESQIEVTFTEAVTDADEIDNYTLLDSDGEEVEDAIDSISYADEVATIDFEDTLSGVHSLVIDTIEDASENEIAATTIEFDVDDLTAPLFTDFTATLYNAGLTGQMIRVEFDEAMNAEDLYSVIDAANYTIGAHNLTDLEDDYTVEISLTDGGKTVQIEVSIDNPATASPAIEGLALTAADDIVLARVADAAGNYTAAFSGTIDVVAAATVGVESVELTAVDTVVVTFDDLLSEFDANDFVLESATGTDLTISKRAIAMNDDGNTEVTLTLTADLTYNALVGAVGTNDVAANVAEAGDIVNLVTIATTISENQYGESLVASTTVAVADATAAELYDDGVATVTNAWEDYFVSNGDDTFTLTFTELVTTSNTDFLGNDFVVEADGDALVLGTDYSVEIVGAPAADVIFTLLGDYSGFAGEISVVRAATTNYLTDVALNDVDEFDTDTCDVTNTVAAAAETAVAAYEALPVTTTVEVAAAVVGTADDAAVAAVAAAVTAGVPTATTNALTARIAAAAVIFTAADTAHTAVVAYEGLAIGTSAEIATAVANAGTAADASIALAVTAGAPTAATDALTARVDAKTALVTAADAALTAAKATFQTAITAAQAAHDATTASVDGTDVAAPATWATAANRTTFQTAVTAAQTAHDAGTATIATLATATTTLSAAVTTFAGQTAVGTM